VYQVGFFGIGAASEIFGIDIGLLIVATTSAIQRWFLAAGIVLLTRGVHGLSR
jgi:hypothetical protein